MLDYLMIALERELAHVARRAAPRLPPMRRRPAGDARRKGASRC